MNSTLLARFRARIFSMRFPGLSTMGPGWTLALASTLAFSLSTPLGKIAINLSVNPTTLAVLRFGIAITLLAVTFWLTAPGKLKTDRRCFFIATGAGLVNGLGSVAFYWSLTRLDASIATMIFILNPLVVLGLLALRGERLTYRHFIRMGLGLGGVYLVVGPGGQVDLMGVFLVVIGVVCVAIELVLIQWFLQAYDARTITLYVLLGMTAAITGVWLWEGAEWHNLSGPTWLLVILLAVIGTYLAWWAMFTGLQQIGSGQISMLLPLETLLTVIWSFILLGERFSAWQYGGAALILLSAALARQRLMRTRWRPRWRAWRRV